MGGFFDEAAHRIVLATKVLVGRLPMQMHKRFFNRSLEAPVLIEMRDWTTDRRIASVLVWPVLEAEPEDAEQAHFERAQQVYQVLAEGTMGLRYDTRLEVDWGLMWDHRAKCWRASDGFHYDGAKQGELDA